MAEEKEMSREEYIAHRDELKNHYASEIDFLKIQKEYETLLTEIDEIRARRIINQVRVSELLAGPSSEDEMPAEVPTKARKLKTEK